jgi:hypothetical protein
MAKEKRNMAARGLWIGTVFPFCQNPTLRLFYLLKWKIVNYYFWFVLSLIKH